MEVLTPSLAVATLRVAMIRAAARMADPAGAAGMLEWRARGLQEALWFLQWWWWWYQYRW
jgi:hypothetical protein